MARRPTVDQMAKDVAAFLAWTAEPNLESRHAAGLAICIFLLIASILGYLAYQQLWYSAKREVLPVGSLDPKIRPKRAARRPSKASPASSGPSRPVNRPFTRRSAYDRSYSVVMETRIMRVPRLRFLALAAASGLALSGCAYGMYGDPYGYG